MRKRFFSIIVCVVMLFTMNVTAFAAETQENYSETEKTMTFEITPTALTSGSSRHSVGMLNSFFGTNDTVATSALGSFTISSTSVPSGSTISKIVVTSTKSSGSSGNETSNYLLLKMRIMEMAHLTDIQTAKVGIVLLLLQILAIII